MALENPDLLRTPGLTLKPKPLTPAPVAAINLGMLFPQIVSFALIWFLVWIFRKK